MRPMILMIAAMIIACYPRTAFSQVNDDLNYGNPLYHNLTAYSWQPYSYGATFWMDFKNNEEYMIEIEPQAPNLIQISSIDILTVDGMSSYITYINEGSEFTFQENSSLRFHYVLPANVSSGQTQRIDFKVYRKQFFSWNLKSTNYYYVTTLCPTSAGIIGTLSGIDYEVSDHLTVYTSAFPNGGLTELDGGQSVTLNPGFSTNLSGGGAVQAIIDGCGGAYRPANNSSTDNTSSVKQSVLNQGNVSVYPNPATDKCTVSFPTALEGKELTLEVMDINGRILYSHREVSKQGAEIDLRNFETGIYFISISGEGINYNQKLIKQ